MIFTMKQLRVILLMAAALVVANSCAESPKTTFDPASVADAQTQISRVEPLSWWVGMKTPLQLMISGEDISEYDVRVEGAAGVELTATHKADSPNYIFADVTVDPNAEAGVRYLVFSRGDEEFKLAYNFDERREGSAQRGSFTTADMIYLIMPDRFANGDQSNDSTDNTVDKLDRDAAFGRHGGDIQGIINNMDYISGLGATAIWMTPLLEDNEPEHSYHGYACTDYYQIDPRYGSNELYKQMVAQGHEHGIKTIMDIVTNHCGVSHRWIKDLPFEDWIHQHDEYLNTNHVFSTNMDPNASQYDLHLQESGWFVPSMPDMNLDNEFVLNYFKQWAVWWIEYANLDGFRVDTYPYNEKVPMSEWNKAVLAEYPNFNIVGECWTGNAPQLAYWQGGNDNKDGFDSHLPSIMDFPLHDAVRNGLVQDSKDWGQGVIKVYEAVSNDFLYHDLSKMMIFLGNHDTERVADVLQGDPAKVKMAMTILSTMRGIPQIFAGDELMFQSSDMSLGHGGLRVDFPGGWQGDKVNLFDPSQHTGSAGEIYDHVSTLLNWRKTKDVIHNGKLLHFITRDNTYAYFRYDDKDAVFVYINNSDEDKIVPWANYSEVGSSLEGGRNVLTGESVDPSQEIVVPAQSSLVVEFSR